jgi:hypothetical protein
LGKEIGIHYLFVVLAIMPFVTINRQYKFFQWLFGLASIAILALLLNLETIGSINESLPQSYLPLAIIHVHWCEFTFYQSDVCCLYADD